VPKLEELVGSKNARASRPVTEAAVGKVTIKLIAAKVPAIPLSGDPDRGCFNL